jgi:hypothetical protein
LVPWILAALLLIGVVTPAAAQDGGMYGARPAPGGGGDRSAGAFQLSAAAGTSVSDSLEVLNFTNSAAVFDLYATNAIETAGGGLAPAARDASVTGSASWIRFSVSSVEVPPRSSATIAFTVAVPDDAARGAELSALIVEPQLPTDRGSIAARSRIGLWLTLTVTGRPSAQPGAGLTLWGWPWTVIVPLLVALVVWLEYATRGPRRQWLVDRREERAAVEDLRKRRRLRQARTGHH